MQLLTSVKLLYTLGLSTQCTLVSPQPDNEAKAWKQISLHNITN